MAQPAAGAGPQPAPIAVAPPVAAPAGRGVHFGRAAFTAVIARGAIYVSAALSSIVVARALGPSGKGVFTLAITLGSLFPLLFDLGLSFAAVRAVQERRGEPRLVFGTALAAYAGLGLAGEALLLLAGVTLGGSVLRGMTAPVLAATAVGCVGAYLSIYLTWALVALNQAERANLAGALGAMLLVPLLGAGFVVLGATPAVAVVAWTVSAAAPVAILGWLTARAVGWRLRFSIASLRGQMHLAGGPWVYLLLVALTDRQTTLVVNAVKGSGRLGVYSVAQGFGEMLWQLSFAVGAMLFSKLSRLDQGRRAEYAAAVTRYAVALAVPGAVVACLVARPLIRLLYGADYAGAVTPFYWLAPGIVAYTVARLLAPDLLVRDRARGLAAALAGSFVLALALKVWWTARWGIGGAAAATTVGYLVTAVAVLYLFGRHTGIHPWRALVVRGEDVRAARERLSWAHLRALVLPGSDHGA